MSFFDLGLGDLVSAGAKIFGGIIGNNQQENANAANLAVQQAAMRDSLQLRAADARDAEKQFGINALTLLGSPTSMPSAVAVGDNALGDSVSSAGQDIGRAVAAATSKSSRMDELNEKLVEAKIANVNSDTVRNQALASEISRKLTQPGTGPGVPLPPEDPRGPVIPLMQRARDPRNGKIYWIPSDKAASPLQTGLASAPINTMLGAKSIWELGTPERPEGVSEVPVRPDAIRAATDYWGKFFGGGE